ncbi:clasp N terminal-domain-containing protein [Phycomyces nitens]|nr:clasp N terminal-domain-containing protein [Phycomyces nitens]
MTAKEEFVEADVDPVQLQIASVKDLEAEAVPMIQAYKDKETEYNWEAREKSALRLRGILRGNAPERFPDALQASMRQMVDGIIKGIESLRTSLVLQTLALVVDIGVYMGKSVDQYIFDHIFNCLLRCASVTRKIVALKAKSTTLSFIRHASYQPKIINLLWLTMNEKNNQARLYGATYTKVALTTLLGRDPSRSHLDRSGATDLVEKIILKGIVDATLPVKEICREIYVIFAEHWKDRAEAMLRTLSPALKKTLERAMAAAPPSLPPPTTSSRRIVATDRQIYSPNNSSSSLRTSSSVGSHRNVDVHDAVSPSSSSASTGSTGSLEPLDRSHAAARSVSPSLRSTSPHLTRVYNPASPASSHLQVLYPPPPTPVLRKTRAPVLTRKKSTIGQTTKRKLSLLSMLNNEDLNIRCDGLLLLTRKLAPFPYNPQPNAASILVESGTGVSLDGEHLKTIVWAMLDEDNTKLYETLSTWPSVAGIFLKLIPFDEYLPRLILDASADENTLKTDDDISRSNATKLALKRAKAYLKTQDPNLAEHVFDNFLLYGVADTNRRAMGTRKDPAKNSANRRKFMRSFLEWLDELVMPMIGLDPEDDEDAEPAQDEWVGPENVASRWFESDINVRHCLDKLFPLVSTSAPGSVWHIPLVSFVSHLRLVNQRLFETIASTLDEQTIAKISRVLGVYIRPIPDYVCQAAPEELDMLGVAVSPDETQAKSAPPPIQPPNVDLLQALEDIRLESPAPYNDPIEPQTQESSIKHYTATDLGHSIYSPPPQTYEAPTRSKVQTTRSVSHPTHTLESISHVEPNRKETPPPSLPSIEPEHHEPEHHEPEHHEPEHHEPEHHEPKHHEPKHHEPEHHAKHIKPHPVDEIPQIEAIESIEPIEPIEALAKEHLIEPVQSKISDIPDDSDLKSAFEPERPIESIATPEQIETISPIDPVDPVDPVDPIESLELPVQTTESFGHPQGLGIFPQDFPNVVEQTNYNPIEHSRATPLPVEQAVKESQTIAYVNSIEVPGNIREEPIGVYQQAPENVGIPQTSLTNGYPTHSSPAFEDEPLKSASPLPSLAPIVDQSSGPEETEIIFVQQTLQEGPYLNSRLVNYPLPVFKENPRTQHATPLSIARGGRDKTVTLYSLVDKMYSSNADYNTFRRLIRLARESPVLKSWDQGGATESGSDLWGGGLQDGGNFVEVIQGALAYLKPTSGLVLGAMELVQQLAATQSGLFRFYERKKDVRGMTLEGRLARQLLLIRASQDTTMCAAADDALESVLGAVSAQTAFELLLSYLIHHLSTVPYDREMWVSVRYPPVGSAFTYLAKWVKEINDGSFVTTWLRRGGAEVFRKGMNDGLISVRKSCVEAIVAFQDIVGDSVYELLDDLRDDQLNLVKHYVAKSIRKKASIRSMSVASQMR